MDSQTFSDPLDATPCVHIHTSHPMKCPFCSSNNNNVLETRVQRSGEAIRRRRECGQCGQRFTTVETLVLLLPNVIKKDGRREPFNKEKILQGIQAACQKRPVPKIRTEQMCEAVCNWALKSSLPEILASDIGNRVLSELKEADHVAFVRFASVHRTFNNLDEFLKKLDGEGPEL